MLPSSMCIAAEHKDGTLPLHSGEQGYVSAFCEPAPKG